MKFLSLVFHNLPNKAAAEPQKPAEPTGEIVSQITFGYKEVRFMVTRLYDAALGKYSVIANIGDYEQHETGLTEDQADEYEDSIYSLLLPTEKRSYR